ncbi:MAG: hypothetical protein OEL69_08395 [Nitrosopumilus sp.]|jgi:hypothetical protein|nr:hypothetical protein [Nitrosopumilus sp.]
MALITGEVEVSEHGMAVFNLKMVAENSSSSDVVLIHCSGATILQLPYIG